MIYHSNNEGFILAETAKRHHWQGHGMMSIKCFFGGEALYRVGNAYHVVGENHYFLLNEGQEYEITIDSKTPIESFCIFLPTALLNDVRSHELDAPIPDATPTLFYERVYLHDTILIPTLLSLRQQIHHLNSFEIDERMHDLADCLLIQQTLIKNNVNDLPFARSVTRDEIYRRIYRARDTMLAMLDQPLTLEELAGIALMSQNHFLRCFKAIFHETPYQYLRRHRLEKARTLLESTSHPITEICFSVGFASLGSFSWAFRRHFGSPPSAYRKHGDFEEVNYTSRHYHTDKIQRNPDD